MRALHYITTLTLLFCSLIINAQSNKERDTLKVQKREIIYFKSDTLKLPDSLTTEQKNSDFWREYISNRKSSAGKTISRLLITPAKNKNTIDPKLNAAHRFEPFTGMKISKVNVTVVPPYGPNIYNYSPNDTTAIEWHKKIVNATHFKTSRRLITRQLTTKIGSTVDPFTLVQEEISIKEMRNINDAVIILTPDPDNDNSVIMEIICKDKFSWSGSIESDFIHTIGGEISNSNMFGLGQYAEYKFKYDSERWKTCGNIFRFEYPNIVGTHINSSIYYRNDYVDKLFSIGFERPFLTNETKWAGGILFNRVFYSYNLPDKTIMWIDTKFNYRSEEIWGGHAVVFNEKNDFNKTLHITGRLYGTNNKNRKDTLRMDQMHFYKDRLNVLLSMQYTSLKYYKGVQIFDLGRSEFVPTGFNIGIVGGYEWCKIQPAGYMEVFGNYSYFNRENEHYYGASLTLATFLNKENGFNRGLLNVTAQHISNPLPMGDFTYRIYSNATYTKGYKRYPNEYLFMTDNEIRGFKADSLFGGQKMGLSIGATAFSPVLKYDFRVAVGAFVDMGVVAEQEKSIMKSKSYFGLGLQLNLQNNYLLVKNLSIRFVWYPRVPQIGSSRDVSLLISNWSKNSFHNYSVTKPQMTVYK